MPANTQQLEIINGWKEIANYLGKSVRTVQRYERVLGLPVRRPARKSIASVIATKVELDAWIAAAPVREQFQLTTAAVDNTSLVNEFRLKTERLYQLGLKNQQLQEELVSSVKLLLQNIHLTALQSHQLNQVPSKSRFHVLTFDPKGNGDFTYRRPWARSDRRFRLKILRAGVLK